MMFASKTFKMLFLCMLVFVLAGKASAVLINEIMNVTATASDEAFAPAILTVDGSGLDAGYLHDHVWGNYWLAGSTSAGLSIEWTFDQVYPLEKMQVWNCPEYWWRGMKFVLVEYSGDGGTNWSTLIASQYLEPHPSDGWPSTIPFGYTDEIPLGGVFADKVRFTALASGPNHGGDATGLAEVRFVEVPEPASIVLLGLSGLALLRKKRA